MTLAYGNVLELVLMSYSIKQNVRLRAWSLVLGTCAEIMM